MSSVYDEFYKGISPESWEYFAVDFLQEVLGCKIIDPPSRGADGGKDSLVACNGRRYIVSCKHLIGSEQAVGVGDEQSIVDRIHHHNAQGFIGFYSTVLSSTLSERFEGLKKAGYDIIYYDSYKICENMPRIRTETLQKYTSPESMRYSLSVEGNSYEPLRCLGCGEDILSDAMIPYGLAMVVENGNKELEYIYGCKKCFGEYECIYWLELNQGLHPEQLHGWNIAIDELTHQYSLSNSFYKNKSDFESRLPQRLYPSNWGTWL